MKIGTKLWAVTDHNIVIPLVITGSTLHRDDKGEWYVYEIGLAESNPSSYAQAHHRSYLKEATGDADEIYSGRFVFSEEAAIERATKQMKEDLKRHQDAICSIRKALFDHGQLEVNPGQGELQEFVDWLLSECRLDIQHYLHRFKERSRSDG